MARQIVVLALVFVAIVGLVSAQSPAAAPKVASESSPAPVKDTPTAESPVDATPTAESPVSTTPSAESPDNDLIGTSEGPSGGDYAAVEAPIGGPVSADAYGPASALGGVADGAKSPSSGACVLEVSAIAAAAAVAGFIL